jgi:hypothetical protein
LPDSAGKSESGSGRENDLFSLRRLLMPIFNRTANDQEIELVATRAAEIAWAVENETGIPPKSHDIMSVVNFALRERNLKAAGDDRVGVRDAVTRSCMWVEAARVQE